MADSSNLKSEAIIDLMKQHFSTDAGKELVKKIGLVYQFQIAPKKIGVDEVVYTVDLKKGEVTKGVEAEAGYLKGKLELIAAFLKQGRLAEQKSKGDLLQMVRFGAEMVFSSKGSSIADEDIDRIIVKGEESTAELDAKMLR